MKKFIEYCIRMKNPTFSFDSSISTFMLIELVIQRGLYVIRAFRLLLFLKSPWKIFLGKQVGFYGLHKIKFGSFVTIGHYCYLSALGKGNISIGNNSSIGAFSRLIISTTFNNPGLYIHIGNNVGIGEFAYLGGAGGLSIGDDCIIGQYLSCHPENHYFENPEILIRQQGTSRKGITIEKNCWVGAKVTILDGVRIGANSVIAAGSVVTKSFPDNSILAGVPAKLIRTTCSLNPQTA